MIGLRRKPATRTVYVTRIVGPSAIDRQIAELEHDEHERVIEQRIRARLADELYQLRHRRREHQPDSWFWAITHAERVVRGES